MKTLKVFHISFSKEDLDCIPEDEAAFLLQIGGLIQEVISLQKFVYMSSHGAHNHVQRVAENAQAMYFYRLLAGNLFEGWKLLTERHQEYRITIAKYKPKLPPIAKSAFEKLKQYFSDKNNACERIRNKFSHHHDYGEILKIIRKWPKGDKLDFYLSEKHANCRYIASDTVTTLAMLGTTELKEVEQNLDALLKEIGDLAGAFIEVVSEYLSLIMGEISKAKKIEGNEISIPNVPSLDEMRLHYFVAEPS